MTTEKASEAIETTTEQAVQKASEKTAFRDFFKVGLAVFVIGLILFRGNVPASFSIAFASGLFAMLRS